ncbi:hypothetical protein [Nocardia sp. NBC_01377]|uniref:hypothetical protein n=1 Tax=Nocardia sp. NBC_01377 TaxID=2903595 RepID=UPI00386FDB21
MAASAATYLQSEIDQLDTGMARQAAPHGATFIDVSESTFAHDICAGPQSWMVGALPVSADAPVPMHPTHESHRDTADRIVEAHTADGRPAAFERSNCARRAGNNSHR